MASLSDSCWQNGNERPNRSTNDRACGSQLNKPTVAATAAAISGIKLKLQIYVQPKQPSAEETAN